ncbi:hypothetical protein [Ravibacter arvi]|uniref:hypothetical protein n=1 Tax=Ravibacter arvi TaxID=2051041 RepID=UPI0031EF5C10
MERGGTEGSPVIKKPSERDWVLGPGDPSTGRDDPPVGAAPSIVLSMVAPLPDGHPEWNAVESKDLLLL